MYGFLIVLHLLICILLVSVVLAQSGKGGGLAGGAFGGSAQTVFGGRGATDFFTRATMVLGAAFFISSLALAMLSSANMSGTRSLIQNEARHTQAAPGALRGPGTPAGTQPGRAPAGGAPAPSTAPAPSGTPATSGAGSAPPPPPPAGGSK